MRLGAKVEMSVGLIRKSQKREFATTAMRREGLRIERQAKGTAGYCLVGSVLSEAPGVTSRNHFIGELAAAREPAPERLEKALVTPRAIMNAPSTTK
jgi:hypothetical protein